MGGARSQWPATRKRIEDAVALLLGGNTVLTLAHYIDDYANARGLKPSSIDQLRITERCLSRWHGHAVRLAELCDLDQLQVMAGRRIAAPPEL